MLPTFGERTTNAFYVVQLVSFVIWCMCARRMVKQQEKYQTEDWQVKAVGLFIGYCFFEFFRIIDCAYTDFDTGLIYCVWGIVPWWMRIYAWVLRDVLMFKGICVYLEHALVWTHHCVGTKVPQGLLVAQRVFCYFGNVVFLVGATLYMTRNDQFWQPVCALGQVPPNVMVAIACYYLRGYLKQVPDGKERAHAVVVNSALLVAAAACLLVFPPWAIPRMLTLYREPAAAVSTVSYGSSMLLVPPPAYAGLGNHLDLFLESVELSVGWCGCLGLLFRSLHEPGPGESLVLSSEEVGAAVAKATGKKAS